MPARQKIVVASHGSPAVGETGGDGTPVLLIHGKFVCRGVFHHDMQGPLLGKYPMIAFNLPGHGQSGDAINPRRVTHADATIELFDRLGDAQVIVFRLVARRSGRDGDAGSFYRVARSDDQWRSTCGSG